ncbi:MAG: thioredoxin domain-containing protein [Rhodospirillales bacterium]|nr:thioredoxin domain-containing protein [Acetobacter sp.]
MLPQGPLNRLMRMRRFFAPALIFALAPLGAVAQTSLPPNQLTNFRDTSSFKPPAGAKVAVIEYEDLQCPACAHAFPMVHAAVSHYHIPIEENDFQIPGHPWSHDGAIFAHYLKAKVSPEIAEQFRREVFASQFRIASKDDLRNFEESFMKARGKQMPFVIDPTGQYDREVNATTAQGERIGVAHTPTILVVTQNHWIQVEDPQEMYAAIDQAQAEAGRSTPTASNAHRVSPGVHK